MSTITQVITTLSDPPDPDTMTPEEFSDAAAASVDSQYGMVAELNTWAGQVNTVAGEVSASTVIVTAQANSAVAAANATIWVSGTTYVIGDARWSPANYQSYRRTTNGAGTTDPSQDATNWAPALSDINDAAVTSTGTCVPFSRELCAAVAAITRTMPAGMSVGTRIGFKDAGQLFATYRLTITPPSGHRIEDQAINETLTVSRNYVGFELRQTAAGVWRIF